MINYDCLASKRPDVVALYLTYHPDWSLSQTFADWWRQPRSRVPQVAPDPGWVPDGLHDDSGSFTDLVAYANMKGCLVVGQPADGSAGPGAGTVVQQVPTGGSPPAPVPHGGGGFSISDTLNRFFGAETNPFVSVGLTAAVVWFGYKMIRKAAE